MELEVRNVSKLYNNIFAVKTNLFLGEENLVSIASELKLPDVSYAEYLFPYRDNYKIAKLLK